MHRNFATVCSRITRFSPECSEKITVYQSMQNLYQMVRYSLIKKTELDTYYERRHPHVNMTPLTVEDRLVIKSLQTEKRLIIKNDC